VNRVIRLSVPPGESNALLWVNPDMGDGDTGRADGLLRGNRVRAGHHEVKLLIDAIDYWPYFVGNRNVSTVRTPHSGPPSGASA